MRIFPLRLEAGVVDKMDDAWRERGLPNRMEFFRRALGHYLKHLGATDAARAFEGWFRSGGRPRKRAGEAMKVEIEVLRSAINQLLDHAKAEDAMVASVPSKETCASPRA